MEQEQQADGVRPTPEQTSEAITRVLLYSGGWDSTLAGHLYPDASKLYVDLESPYSDVEMEHLPEDVKVVGLDLFQFVLPDGYHVPQRNAILALIGAAYGMSQGAKEIEVLICGMKEDLTAPDKNPAYFEALGALASLFDPSGEYKITVRGFFEDDKITLWEKAGKPDVRDIISCYAGNNCGGCLACKRRVLYLDFIYPGEFEGDFAQDIKDLEGEGWIIDDRIKAKHL